MAKGANLGPNTRRSVAAFLLKNSNNGSLGRGDVKVTAARFGCHRNTIIRLWRMHRKTTTVTNEIGDVDSRMRGRCGRRGYAMDELRAEILAVPVERRMTIRSLAASIDKSSTVVSRLLASDLLKRHTNTTKPALTPANKLQRVQYELHHACRRRSGAVVFFDLYDVVHIDETGFNEDSDKKGYYLFEGEATPLRQRQSKRFIRKTMFITAVARPRHDPHKKPDFDGKIGIWASAEEYEAQ